MFNLKDYNLNEKVETYLKSIARPIDEKKLERWLKEKNVAFKSNPTAYAMKVLPSVIESGVLDAIEYIPASQPLFNAMREKGVVVKQDDCMYIDLLLTELAKRASEKEITDWCSSCLKYIISKNEKPTSKHFIDVFKKSKAINALGIDWEELQKRYADKNAEWEATMLALEMEGR